MHRYELTDEQWDLIEYLFPERTEGRGRPRKSAREVLNALFWILRSGAPWRDLPERYGPWQSVYLVTDGQGTPLAVHVTAGQVHESKEFEKTVNAVRIPQLSGSPRRRPERYAGDKGYSYPRIREWLRDHGIGAVIAQRSDQREQRRGRPIELDKEAYRQRHVIENCIGWLKECRRVGIRFEKLAVNFLAMIKLAMLQRYLRFQFSDSA